MKRVALCVAGLGALAACNSQPQVNLKNATGKQVAQAVTQSGVISGDSFVQPGEWQSKVTIQQMDIPGMPPEYANRMKQMVAAHQVDTHSHCLTPADVKKPKEDFFAGQDKSCRYEHFTMGAGKIDIQMVCHEEDSTQTSTMNGSYTPTSYSMDVASNMTGGDQNGAVMKMHVDAQRTGECTAKDD